MRKTGWLLMSLVPAVAIWSGAMCPMSPPGNANDNSSTNANTTSNGNSNASGNANSSTNSNGSADRFRLKVNWLGDGFGSTLNGAAVWIFSADERVLRAEGDYREGPNTFRFVRSPNNPERLREYDSPAGNVVTLIAFEDAGRILNIWGGAVPPTAAETNQIEFITFDLDGGFDSAPENGVAAVTMDSDKEVFVTFAPMPVITIDQTFQGRYRIELDMPNWLNDPGFNGVSPTTDFVGDEGLTACLGGSTGSGTWLHFAYKTGTTLTITSEDCNIFQWMWREWGVNDGCSGRTCNLIFGDDSSAIAQWDEVNP